MANYNEVLTLEFAADEESKADRRLASFKTREARKMAIQSAMKRHPSNGLATYVPPTYCRHGRTIPVDRCPSCR